MLLVQNTFKFIRWELYWDGDIYSQKKCRNCPLEVSHGMAVSWKAKEKAHFFRKVFFPCDSVSLLNLPMLQVICGKSHVPPYDAVKLFKYFPLRISSVNVTKSQETV